MPAAKPYSLSTLSLKFLSEKSPMTESELVSAITAEHKNLAKNPPENHRIYDEPTIRRILSSYLLPLLWNGSLKRVHDRDHGRFYLITDKGCAELKRRNSGEATLCRPKRFRISDKEKEILKVIAASDVNEKNRKRANILLRASVSTGEDAAKMFGLSRFMVSRIISEYRKRGPSYLGYVAPPKIDDKYLFSRLEQIDKTLKDAILLMASIKEDVEAQKAK